MALLSQALTGYLANSSMIRRMFEAGIELKKKYGEDKVYDFSLGNPDLPVPTAIIDALRDFVNSADKPFSFGYTSNAGAPWAKEALAQWVSQDQNITVGPQDVLLSVGAAGAMNAVFRAILDPGDEVITFCPYFVEYGFYVANHGGTLSTVNSKKDTFAPDVEALEKAITAKTRAIIINSPHNPTGAVYSLQDLKAIAAVLERKSEENGRPIWLLADEPYRFLAFDGEEVPSVLPLYRYALCLSSFSKNMSLPGERIGYVVVSPLLEDKETFMGGLTIANRILGFVNAPIIGQRIIAAALGSNVDKSIYESRRNAMAEVLTQAGYEFTLPKGAFYFFPKAPGGDDKAFIARLAEERVLGVPGSGFGCPGYFRLAFCVDEKVIRNAAEGFATARKAFA